MRVMVVVVVVMAVVVVVVVDRMELLDLQYLGSTRDAKPV